MKWTERRILLKKKIWGVGSSRDVKGTDSLNVSKWRISWKGLGLFCRGRELGSLTTSVYFYVLK